MSTPIAAAGESFASRLLRGILALALALAITLITALVVLGFVPSARGVFAPMVAADRGTPSVALGLALTLVILLPSVLLFWPFLRRVLRSVRADRSGFVPGGRERRSRFRWLGWPMLLVGWVIVLPILLWLASDDPTAREPVTIEEFSPAFPGADRSYAVLMQYSRLKPGPEAIALAAAPLEASEFKTSPKDVAAWVNFVSTHRAALDHDWAALAPQRRWLDELAGFDRIGDLTPVSLDPDSVGLQSWRTLAYHVCATATGQALDGHGDEAVATLVPLVDVNRKLPIYSRTLLRSMTAEVMERLALQTAAIVLDRATVSPAARERLLHAFGAENAAAEARRLVLVDFVQLAPAAFSLRLGDAVAPSTGVASLLHGPLNRIGVFVINPRATINLYADHVHELAGLAESRDLGHLADRAREFAERVENGRSIKNLGGRWLLDLSLPAFGRALDIHWENTDLRNALRQRLAAKT
ncbi:MAG TPA: hypothetical protein VGM73_12430 [Candidatus Didemnitutus sp.]|jgi:hypothetical protein